MLPVSKSGRQPFIRGENIRTGVTAVLPHSGNLYREKVPGAIFVGNGFGKLAGHAGRGNGRHRNADPADVHD
jgi:D-aminopeptidase